MWPPYAEPPMPKKIEPKPKPIRCTFGDCERPPWDELTGLCLVHKGYTDEQRPPKGGRAAGAAFLEEENVAPREMCMAVGR